MSKETIQVVGRGMNDVMNVVYDSAIIDAIQVVGKLLLPYHAQFTPQIEATLKELDSLKQIKDVKIKCLHDGKINPGHHADQPSWCDQCGEEL